MTSGSVSSTEVHRGPYVISTDPARLDASAISDYLARSYWASNRTRDQVDRSLANSLCFGLYHDGRQIGFARVITDAATFAYLCDVYVLEEYRGEGLGKWLVETALAHPSLEGLRRWLLATRDAHELYRQFGFAELANPGRWMEIFDPGAATIQGRSHERAACAINPDSRGGRRE